MRIPAPIARVRSPRKRHPQTGLWALVAILAAFLGWIAWQLLKSPLPPPPASPSAPAPQPSTTNHPPTTPPNSQLSPAHSKSGEYPFRPNQEWAGLNSQLPTAERILAAQIALARQGISPGSIDGRLGPQTRAALRAFQQKAQLPVTGALDAATEERLAPRAPLYTHYLVGPEDLERLLPLSNTWLGKSLQPRLDYETILELVAEKSQAYPALLRRINPQLDWNHITPGAAILVPNLGPPPPRAKAAYTRISLLHRTLEAFDERSALLVHFPCSIARRVEQRPVGELHVAVLAPNPNYTFDPAIFPESAEARQLGRKLILPPGPNNPVGTVWIGLDRPGYGIHGTPRPEDVGRTESHGCFRLANWNAETFLQLTWLGMPVFVEE